jgi:hypothetical protein
MNGWMDGWMDGWIDGWMDGWMDGGREGWVETQVSRNSQPSHRLTRSLHPFTCPLEPPKHPHRQNQPATHLCMSAPGSMALTDPGWSFMEPWSLVKNLGAFLPQSTRTWTR